MMIEVALNENATREANPNVPYSVDEVVADAIACVDAGATIVHFHARDAASGSQRWHDTDFYRRAFDLIRAERDVLLYPTQPGTSLEAFSHVIELADDGRLELATVDIFPVRLTPGQPAAPDPMVQVLTELRARDVACSLGLREVSDTRHLATYRELGLIGDDVVLKIFLNEGPRGPVPDARGLLMYVDTIPAGMRGRFFTTVYGGGPDGACLRRASMLSAAMGGHIRTGLGDNPVIDGRGSATNVEMVEMAVALAHAAGRRVATVAEGRELLGVAGRTVTVAGGPS
jgi:3-keto-5-aminohexanoate cleavage enzyme